MKKHKRRPRVNQKIRRQDCVFGRSKRRRNPPHNAATALIAHITETARRPLSTISVNMLGVDINFPITIPAALHIPPSILMNDTLLPRHAPRQLYR